MPDLDHVAAVRRESDRFLEASRQADLTAPVPSCPGWSVADLVWHLTEVQEFWARIAGELLTDVSDMERIERPADERLSEVFTEQSALLVEALGRRSADDSCWSWHHAGGTVRWVRRRQAHEALIHRVDAELAAASASATTGAGASAAAIAIAEPEPVLAIDGVDEAVTVMIADVPPRATFEADGALLRLRATDAGAPSWTLAFGTLRGTSSRTGDPFAFDAVRVADDEAAPDTTVSGDAWHLDRWLWGRAEADGLDIDGDRGLLSRLRQIATDTTQ